jgi:ribosomal protein S18 acetylase RimI-like enzyme
MPRTADLSAVRSLLNTDREWSAYALGDLTPEATPHCSWHVAPGDVPALALVYRGFRPPVLFALGPAPQLRPILEEVATEAELFLHVRPEVVTELSAWFEVVSEEPMDRMVLRPGSLRPAECAAAVRLGAGDAGAVQRLYSDGQDTGESPGFFDVSMLRDGVFFGVREGGDLAAVAGTHLVVPAEGMAAIGNVYTRRDRRGRGLGAATTTAVAVELERRQLRTIVLNVAQAHAAARHVYERLGFVRYVEYREGLVRRRPTGREATSRP